MGKKKKIREEFNQVFESGDDRAIKEMLTSYPWLLDEMSSSMDAAMAEEHQIAAAIGIMEDELGHAVPMDQIMFCLRQDFGAEKSEPDLRSLLTNIENLNLVKNESSGWTLTEEGGDACDAYLNSMRNLEF
ncbi:MAG: hypothetical protein GY870_05500 [archaeon]|nr:hypothetical protein [archaeon]